VVAECDDGNCDAVKDDCKDEASNVVLNCSLKYGPEDSKTKEAA
jgi:hypothetical protein